MSPRDLPPPRSVGPKAALAGIAMVFFLGIGCGFLLCLAL